MPIRFVAPLQHRRKPKEQPNKKHVFQKEILESSISMTQFLSLYLSEKDSLT